MTNVITMFLIGTRVKVREDKVMKEAEVKSEVTDKKAVDQGML